MRDDRAHHDEGKQDSRVEGVPGNKQADGAGYFQHAGEIPESLAEARLVEDFNHCGGSGELGAAGP